MLQYKTSWKVLIISGIIISFSLFTNRILSSCLYADDREQTYLYTSQPYYLSGEMLHYVVYLYNFETGRFEVPSKILITEFLNQYGTLIFRHFHSMIQKDSPGSCLLPDTLETGCYWLRAYTRYQVGYTENLIHYTPVFIVNPEDLNNSEILSKKLTFAVDNSNNPRKTGNTGQGFNRESHPPWEKIAVEITSAKTEHFIREPVNLKIRISGKEGDPGITRFSLTVKNKGQMNSRLIQPANLSEYLALEGKSFIYRIGDIENQHSPNADLHEKVNGIPGTPQYNPQKELRLYGKLIAPDTKENLSFKAIALTQTGQNPGFKLIFSDSNGNFEFNVLNFVNRENLLVLNAGNNDEIIIENDLIQPSFSPPGLVGNLAQSETFQQYIEKRQFDLSYKKFYADQPLFKKDSSNVEQFSRFRLYKKADLIYNLDDYIELTDMHEVIIELLPNVKIFRENDRTRIRLYHHENAAMIPDPLFLINGRIVKDNEYILNMNNRNVARIEVLYKKSTLEPFGPLGMGGVVAIYTKTPVPVPYGLDVDMEGYHESREKIIQVSPAVIHSDNYPDFNPILYWNPACLTDVQGVGEMSFNTNDLTGEFEIILEGITEDGIPFFTSEVLSVERPFHP